VDFNAGALVLLVLGLAALVVAVKGSQAVVGATLFGGSSSGGAVNTTGPSPSFWAQLGFPPNTSTTGQPVVAVPGSSIVA
jgi:hypothetical protein